MNQTIEKYSSQVEWLWKNTAIKIHMKTDAGYARYQVDREVNKWAFAHGYTAELCYGLRANKRVYPKDMLYLFWEIDGRELDDLRQTQDDASYRNGY